MLYPAKISCFFALALADGLCPARLRVTVQEARCGVDNCGPRGQIHLAAQGRPRARPPCYLRIVASARKLAGRRSLRRSLCRHRANGLENWAPARFAGHNCGSRRSANGGVRQFWTVRGRICFTPSKPTAGIQTLVEKALYAAKLARWRAKLAVRAAKTEAAFQARMLLFYKQQIKLPVPEYLGSPNAGNRDLACTHAQKHVDSDGV